ncbi:MAG: hypothetical protein IPL52_10900 [Flavobacteriales bacterium]|nr:hypothetical protein [Flavobacteriales bacterium]
MGATTSTWGAWTSTRTSWQAHTWGHQQRGEHDGLERGPEQRCLRVRIHQQHQLPGERLAQRAAADHQQWQQRQGLLQIESDLSALEFSTYYGGTNDDYDPVGERGIKFSNCRIYTIVTAQSNNIPLTQGELNTTKNSPTSRYEPGLVVWANPPDTLGNTITYQGVSICPGATPGDIIGSVPAYTLPTVVRNNSASSYPAFPSAASYQWQISPDSTNWTNINGATGQNLSGAQIGAITQTTYIRRIIGGDACILAGAADR